VLFFSYDSITYLWIGDLFYFNTLATTYKLQIFHMFLIYT
jgi:hypothetical protein